MNESVFQWDLGNGIKSIILNTSHFTDCASGKEQRHVSSTPSLAGGCGVWKPCPLFTRHLEILYPARLLTPGCKDAPGVVRCHFACQMTGSGLHHQVSLSVGVFSHFYIFAHAECERGNNHTRGSTKNALGKGGYGPLSAGHWGACPKLVRSPGREKCVRVQGTRGQRDFCTTVSINPVNTHLLRPPASIKCSRSRVKAPLILEATTPPSSTFRGHRMEQAVC